MYERGLVWFRQDLRIDDNTALYQASQQCKQIIPIFVLNDQVSKPAVKDDPRLGFLYAHLATLDTDIRDHGARLVVEAGDATRIIPDYLDRYHCDVLLYNRSYGPGHDTRDKAIYDWCVANHVQVHTYDDYLLIHPAKVPTRKVYTPFFKQRLPLVEERFATWKDQSIDQLHMPPTKAPSLADYDHLFTYKAHPHRPVKDMLRNIKAKTLSNYNETRNIPSIDGTTKLSPYLRFGAISPRKVFSYFQQESNPGHEIIIKELGWREFWHHIAYHFPASINNGFQAKRQHIQRDNNPERFDARCHGKTGYPIVDAGMRQLREENRMHNRVRMIVASFLTKDLLIDWRWGARHFADYLLDHDHHINTGNRQRSASVGADPKPLRIFNPILQSQRFDPDCAYILKYIPELRGQDKQAIHDPLSYPLDYITPIVNHYEQSKQAKVRYHTAKEQYEKKR